MRIFIAHDYRAQINKIVDWVGESFGGVTAEDVAKKIKDTIDRIEADPYRYPLDIDRSGKTIRKAVVKGRTVITFEVDEINQMIYIVNIVDGRTDWKG